jgi:uncharacterized protein (DUF4415 family)
MSKNKKPTKSSDLKRLDAMLDKDIDYSDSPATDKDFWKSATVVLPKNKCQITLRIDDDVLAWFRHQGKGYQSKINAVLRSYVDAHERKK